MANDTTSTPKLWVLDTAGLLLTSRPVCIQKIIYFPNAAADTFTMKQWDESTKLAAGTANSKSGSITSTDTLTSTSNLPSTIEDGFIFEILGSTGTSDNWGKQLVKTAGDANAVVVWNDPWTDEGPFYYAWQTFTTVEALTLRAGASDASPIHLDFGPSGKWFPNLTLETISTSSKIRVYIK